MPRILMVSVLTAAWGWPFDYVVLIIPVIQVITMSLKLSETRKTFIMAAMLLFVTSLSFIPDNVFWLFWLCPALFVWYESSIWSVKNAGKIHDMRNRPLPV